MKYLLGSPDDFHNFVNSIKEGDKVGVVTHTDVDGLVSGLFLQKILESRNIEINFIEFLNYGAGVLEEFYFRRDYDKLFFTDWKVDEDLDILNLLREKGEVLVFDHHPLNEELKDRKLIIKTEGQYCSAHALFDLAKDYFDIEELSWLVCSAVITDYTYNNEEVWSFLKSFYPEVNKDDIYESIPGRNGLTIDNALIYYKPDFKKVYDLVLKKDLISLESVSGEVEEAALDAEVTYLSEAEYFPEKNLYFGYINPKFGMLSKVISKISHEHPDEVFIMAADSSREGFVKLSGRVQSVNVDLGVLLKKCVEGFEDASAGGHPKASAASFPKKYLEEFKERFLKEL